MVFVDTDVMVDILRGYPAATEWLASLADEPIVLSGFVYAELLQGCRNKKDQEDLQKKIAEYDILWPAAETCNRAIDVFAEHFLSDGLGILDALIGQTAADLDISLQTFNAKHYSCVPGLKAAEPYDRT